MATVRRQTGNGCAAGKSRGLNHLFDARELVVIRGSQVLHAVKNDATYFWSDGPENW